MPTDNAETIITPSQTRWGVERTPFDHAEDMLQKGTEKALPLKYRVVTNASTGKESNPSKILLNLGANTHKITPHPPQAGC